MRTCKRGHKYTIERDSRGRNKGCPDCRRNTAAKFHQERKLVAGFLEKHKNTQAKWYKKHGNSEEARLMQRGNRLKSRYWPKLTGWEALRKYENMLAEQDYQCLICSVDQEEYDSPFHVDHCHVTGEVRGLLCTVCNRYIVGGIDTRAKAKKVRINKRTLVDNVLKYFKRYDPEYKAIDEKFPLPVQLKKEEN